MTEELKTNPRYDFSKKPAQRYIKSMLVDISRWQRGLDRDMSFLRRLSSTQHSFWHLSESPVLLVHGEKGVNTSRLEEAAQGVQDYVIDNFNLNIDVKTNTYPRIVTPILKMFYSDEGQVEKRYVHEVALKLSQQFRDNLQPTGHLIVTKRHIEGGWGTATLGTGIVSTDAPHLGPISAHEFMHALNLEMQGYTKDSGNNCVNDCLMNYVLRSDGKLCSTCDATARAYIEGINKELAKYDRKITR
jgi:hypothetical protein